MVHVISPLQCPNQQEVSPEFPSQEISCEEVLNCTNKEFLSNPPPNPLLPPNCTGAAEAVRAEGGGCEQGWKVAGG